MMRWTNKRISKRRTVYFTGGGFSKSQKQNGQNDFNKNRACLLYISVNISLMLLTFLENYS